MGPGPALPPLLPAVVPAEPVTLTPSMMFFIGSAFAEWLAQERGVPLSALRVSVRRWKALLQLPPAPLVLSECRAAAAARGLLLRSLKHPSARCCRPFPQVGQDPRLSSPMMAASIVAGMASRGATVGRFGLCTTPAMFMSCILPGHDYDGGIMITASHLPVNRNGAKFCTAKGGLDKKDITALLTRAAQVRTARASCPGGWGAQVSGGGGHC